MVVILPEDSEEREVVNFLLAMSSGSPAIGKPGDGWRWGILTDTGVSVNFERNYLNDPDERELRVPYRADVPEV